MLIGYARVSTSRQNIESQVDALKDAACKNIFVDKISDRVEYFAELVKENDHLCEGDTLVTSLTKLGRSINNLINEMNEVKDRDSVLRDLSWPTIPNS